MNKQELEKIASTLGGIVCLGVLKNSVADLAGVRYGDIILEVNGIATPTLQSYVDAKDKNPNGMVVKLFRDGRHLEMSFSFSKQGADPIKILTEVVSMRVVGGSALDITGNVNPYPMVN